MKNMIYQVRFTGGFKDGNVFPRRILPGEIVEVDEITFLQMRQSDPSVDLVNMLVPPSSVTPWDGKCIATKKNGKPCTMKALEGEQYCFSHIQVQRKNAEA